MPRKKKQEVPLDPTIKTTSELPVEPKIDYSELWFAERIGTKVNAVLGKDITKNAVLFHSLSGPFQTQKECLIVVEKKQATLDQEKKKQRAILAAEPDPISFERKKSPTIGGANFPQKQPKDQPKKS